MMRDAASLYEELLAVDESASIDAKTGSAIDRSVMETVCAFANEPGLGGGYLLLGVAPSTQGALFGGNSYEVVGVDDPDRLQADLASQCATTFNLPIRPRIVVGRLNEKIVLVVFVAELAPTEKPAFLKSLGLPRGAFRRVGSTDQHGTDDDLIALYQGHQHETYDSAVVKDADLSDFDVEAIASYRRTRAEVNPVADELGWSDPDLLRSLGAAVLEGGVLRPTVAGMLLFGSPMALRRTFPMMRVDYVRVPGREWVQDPDRRFDTVEIRAPLLLTIRRAIAAVRDDLPSSFSLPEGETIRSDETVLPFRVLREAIVNAVMHRSYRIHGAIQIIRYANRLEIRNPGHSLKSEDQLGEPGSQARNPRIAAVLHDLHVAETKGSGIRAMRELMLAQNLLPPAFESSRSPDHFVATFLFHHFVGESDLHWLRALTSEPLSDEEARALVFVRETGAIDNASYRAINHAETLNASAHLRRLRDLDLLQMKGSGNRTYYVPGPRFVSAAAVVEGDSREVGGDPHQPASDPHQAPTDPHQSPTDPHHLDLGVPVDLARRIREAGQRPRRDRVRAFILELCAWKPLAARELGRILSDRDPKDLVREHLAPMLKAGELAYTIPQMPNHPDQKYTIPSPETL